MYDRNRLHPDHTAAFSLCARHILDLGRFDLPFSPRLVLGIVEKHAEVLPAEVVNALCARILDLESIARSTGVTAEAREELVMRTAAFRAASGGKLITVPAYYVARITEGVHTVLSDRELALDPLNDDLLYIGQDRQLRRDHGGYAWLEAGDVIDTLVSVHTERVAAEIAATLRQAPDIISITELRPDDADPQERSSPGQ